MIGMRVVRRPNEEIGADVFEQQRRGGFVGILVQNARVTEAAGNKMAGSVNVQTRVLDREQRRIADRDALRARRAS